jgi:hypothetical protein
MASRNATARVGSAVRPAGGLASPVVNALLVTAALGCGLWTLFSRGWLAWPPNQLLASLYTVAGCLALVGPIVLARRDGAEGGLGELLWMTGGLLVWVFDAVAAIRGDWRTTAWATPLGNPAMGMTILAVFLAGWRCRVPGRGWAWTNVTGWLLGVFWVGMALSALFPSRALGLAFR